MKKKPTLKSLKNKAWKIFSEYVRRRDALPDGWNACYTCMTPGHWKDLQCGHAIPGRHNAVLLDAEICRPQCPRCNVWMRGRYEVFATKLIKENGVEWFEQKLAGAHQLVKFTRADFEHAIEAYKQKLGALV